MLTDNTGLTWDFNQERTQITSATGQSIIINPEWPDHAVLDMVNASLSAPPIKTDADRIAELEAQLAALLAKLS
jgi:3-deoxy-D-arabino-heptulosonate 7-phosphate (DAHP) synthase class II